jgi:hypothetical protein
MSERETKYPSFSVLFEKYSLRGVKCNQQTDELGQDKHICEKM